MMARYSPGEWYGVVTTTGMVLLPDGVPLEAAERVWSAMRAGKSLAAVIEGLVGAFGTSLSSLPDFAVLELTADGVKVAVRGAVEANLRSPQTTGGWLSISGTGVTTWNERAVGEVSEAVLLSPDSVDGNSLPIADGIVRAGSLRLTIADPAVTSGQPELPTPAESSPKPRPPIPAVEPEQPAEDAGADRLAAPEPEDSPRLHAETTLIQQLPPEPAGSEPAAQTEGSAELAAAEAATGDNLYDQLLYGETVLSSVEEAAVREAEGMTVAPVVLPPVPAPSARPPVAPPPPPPPARSMIAELPAFGSRRVSVPPAGDHDGETVLVDELRLLVAAAAAPAGPLPASPVLRLPGIAPVVLEHGAILGTRPRLARVQGSNVPQLITVSSPSQEISRSHLELRVEGSSVLAIDLNSTNGTLLLRSGAEPVRLQPGEANLLVSGDRLDLGDGVVVEFEGLA
ncbi:MAG: FHA domain-containing protein [Propionicimonas sp.]